MSNFPKKGINGKRDEIARQVFGGIDVCAQTITKRKAARDAGYFLSTRYADAYAFFRDGLVARALDAGIDPAGHIDQIALDLQRMADEVR